MSIEKVQLAGSVILLLFAATETGAQSYPVMFVSSAWGFADLGSWPQAGGATGADAADAICQSLAASATLDNPGSFHAWISDSTTDAYCRVLGLSGKKAANCGQATLPDGGPWLRTDGFPFAGSLQELTGESSVLVPARYDEWGVRYASAEEAEDTLTGTSEDGTWAVDLDCDGWSQSTAGTKVRGRRSRTVRDWAAQGDTPCSRRGRLLCFETPPSADPLPLFEETGAPVFVTSARRSGNLGSWPEANGRQGLEAGDEICRTLARDAGLSGPDAYVAWLSTSTVDARDRLGTAGPWKRLDGVPIAADLPDLLDRETFTSISVTERGDYVRGPAWTGTRDSGVAVDGWTCDDWSDETALGHYGQSNETSVHWTNYGGGPCNSTDARLYCFSRNQDGPFFSDGFESGDTTAWSDSVE
jgi:hypothetical protein